MLFRFLVAVVLVTGVSLFGIALEKQNLALKRGISLQHYRLEILREKRSRTILRTHQLGAVPRLAEEWDRTGNRNRTEPDPPAAESPRIHPLLEWRLRTR
jgi:hypothetical protein